MDGKEWRNFFNVRTSVLAEMNVDVREIWCLPVAFEADPCFFGVLQSLYDGFSFNGIEGGLRKICAVVLSLCVKLRNASMLT